MRLVPSEPMANEIYEDDEGKMMCVVIMTTATLMNYT